MSGAFLFSDNSNFTPYFTPSGHIYRYLQVNKLEASTRQITYVSRQALIQEKDSLSKTCILKGQDIEGTDRSLEGISGGLLLSAWNHAKDKLVRKNYSDG